MQIRTAPFHMSRVAFISTYPPRQCGIGTFTQDLVHNLNRIYQTDPDKGNSSLEVLAINNLPGEYNFPPEVHFEIRDQNKLEYQEAANYINLTPIQVVSVQHEYGIYGGQDGSHILRFLQILRKPIVTTLHTVLETPAKNQLQVMKEICALSTIVVVLADHAIEILQKVYKVPEHKIMRIRHGVPDVPFLDSAFYKDQFQTEGRCVLLTFGFLNPGKGIEYAIEAMPRIIRSHPKALYIILGATHPEVKRQFGERYRISLEQRVKDLKLENHVRFQNRFVTLDQLIQFLVASDIYISPSLAREQIVSGTLSYALGCGKSIVSTRSIYAEEILAEGRGMLVPFKDSDAIADAVLDMLDNEDSRNRMRKNAYQMGRHMIWREVANSYANAFEDAVTLFGRDTIPETSVKGPLSRPSLPEVKMDHFYNLTDDTGMLQHAFFTTPNRFHGYCTDDNVRALIVAMMHWRLYNDPSIFKTIHLFLSFLHYAFNPENGRMRNKMGYDRQWLEACGSEDSHGRSIWSLGYTINYAPNDGILGFANALFKQCLPAYRQYVFPRPMAYTILGGLQYLQRFGGDTETRKMIRNLSRKLMELFTQYRSKKWLWCEEALTYANARLPQALIAAGVYLKEEEMLQTGLDTLKWLIGIQTHPEAYTFSFIGNANWFYKDGPKSQFDQQPIEAVAMMDACYQAYLATGEVFWGQAIETGFHWFLGKNDIHFPLYDFHTGGCYDGLEPAGVNLNQGGESTLSWLQALHLMWLL